jgi:hypothetical protein
LYGFAFVLALTPALARAEQAAPADSTHSPLAQMAQAAQSGARPVPDSLVAPPAIGYRFTPVYVNLLSGDVTSVGMKNSMTVNLAAPFGSVFNFLVAAEERHYRLQDKFDENKQLSATLLHTFDVFTSGSIGFLESRIFNRSIIPGGAFQDYIFNDRSVNAGGSYKRNFYSVANLRSVRVDALASGSAVQSERTYKDDETLAALGFGGLATDVWNRRLRVFLRGGRRDTWDKSTTSLAEFDDLGSVEDSLSTGLWASLGDSIFVDAKYVYYHGDRTWADQAQGSLGGQQSGVQYVFQEWEHRDSQAATISLKARVARRFRVDISASHDDQLFDYDVQQTRYSNTVSDALKGTITYTAPWNTKAMVTLEDTKALRDFGPLSVSSYDDIRKKAGLALSHRFSKTLSMEFAGNTMLTRTEYLDKAANPRDRDQIDTSANLRISSRPHVKFTTNVSLAYSASEFVNIDSTQSANNRTRELYELRPGFTYYVSDKFSIGQTYGVSIEYTDYVYKPTSNFLDRNLIFTNRFDFKPTRRVAFVFDYAYNFHDNGSYLPDDETGEEVLIVQGEDRRDRVNLRMDYALMNRLAQSSLPNESDRKRTLAVFSEYRYSRFEDASVFSDVTTVTTDGQLTVGTRGDYDFGKGRALKFSVARVKRFSVFGTDAEKDYWDMRSEFNYPF